MTGRVSQIIPEEISEGEKQQISEEILGGIPGEIPGGIPEGMQDESVSHGLEIIPERISRKSLRNP